MPTKADGSLIGEPWETFKEARPSLTRVNGDATWVLSLPRPVQKSPNPGRSRFNILIDPWFQGNQVLFREWFSTQSHQEESFIATVAELDLLLRNAEEQDLITTQPEPVSYIDIVVISHKMTDHCHRPTLQQISPAVPVFASPSAAEELCSWKHFNTGCLLLRPVSSICFEQHTALPLSSPRQIPCSKSSQPRLWCRYPVAVSSFWLNIRQIRPGQHPAASAPPSHPLHGAPYCAWPYVLEG
jgi:hypothetical protein